ncbi:MAG: hypothetical protein ACQEQG_09390 [Bacillota bacterium]
MFKYKYICQCCGEDYIVWFDSPLGDQPENPHCSEDCTGNCKELERVEIKNEVKTVPSYES